MVLRLGRIAQEDVVGVIASLQNSAVVLGCPIRIGATYRYLCDHPSNCKGHLYRVLSEVLDVPSYQKKVLVLAVSGPDEGLLFTCSLANFAVRYELVEDENDG